VIYFFNCIKTGSNVEKTCGDSVSFALFSPLCKIYFGSSHRARSSLFGVIYPSLIAAINSEIIGNLQPVCGVNFSAFNSRVSGGGTSFERCSSAFESNYPDRGPTSTASDEDYGNEVKINKNDKESL
jgi:hypothetical protein